MTKPIVAVLTVTYGKRWNRLFQTVSAVMKDPYVSRLVIVDNGSKNREEILQGVSMYGSKVHVIHLEKNIGSAGGYALGIEYIKSIKCDFLLMLDDDNVPEDNAIDSFLSTLDEIGHGKVALVGNRINMPGNQEIYYSDAEGVTEPKLTFFEGISMQKVRHFLALTINKQISPVRSRRTPRRWVPNESFVYGGAFIPIDAVRQAPLPDRDLILYGDDIEYSWGIKRLGYESYVCYSPKIYDLEVSFGEGSQAVGLYNPATALFKLYYRIRNMVRISIRNTKQNQVILFMNILLWVAALSLLGLRYGLHREYFKRMKLVARAVYGGYVKHAPIPKEAALP